MDSEKGELGLAYVSFSKVTVADWVPSAPGVTESEVIFPLVTCKLWIMLSFVQPTYQKLKKSFTSFSLVEWEIFLCSLAESNVEGSLGTTYLT